MEVINSQSLDEVEEFFVWNDVSSPVAPLLPVVPVKPGLPMFPVGPVAPVPPVWPRGPVVPGVNRTLHELSDITIKKIYFCLRIDEICKFCNLASRVGLEYPWRRRCPEVPDCPGIPSDLGHRSLPYFRVVRRFPVARLHPMNLSRAEKK